ncbi:hypothetical protein ILUMI_20407 [Ignelater luminosus]|uniref:Arrestin C-terminal-like domain-containing protein n=1 Tax=Ignelater luminosus TaxID=2038154 RepID=A0A8K0CKQ5_IGNLU|nr:hypothetical protein ILUMI_20407 [Ignelater luminosus]
MGLKSCEIVLDNNWAAYYAGQTVTGRVELVVDSPKKVRGITILFKGEANTNWVIEESKTNNDGKQENERIELVGSEEYFKIQYYLIGGQGGEVVIPPGQHTYPFTCVLPPTLPSSFEGEFGYVRYIIKVTLDRPWKFDQEAKRAFTVLSPVDLNVNSRLKDPARITLEKFFCCCWCKSGPLTCVISIPCTGYVPGQVIPVVAEVDNISNVEILGVQFTLQKIVTYHSQTPRREVKKDLKIITELKVGPVAPHGSNTWNQPLTIPPIPPSNLTNCGLIDLDYELKIEVNVSGFHTNMESKIPITIGTVPFSSGPIPSNAQADSTVVNITEPPAGMINDTSSNPAFNMGWVTGGSTDANNAGMYPALPAFAASQFGTNSIQEKSDNEHMLYSNNNQQYYPMYPVYNYVNNNPSQ